MLLVVFDINGQKYGLDFSVVERVVRMVEVTPLPKAPDFVAGIINMQGQVLPVLDLRRLLRLPVKETTLNDQMIVARTSGLKVAIMADSVTGVAEYKGQDIVAPEKIFPGIEYVEGVAKLADGMVFIYDLDRFLLSEARAIREHLPEGVAGSV